LDAVKIGQEINVTVLSCRVGRDGLLALEEQSGQEKAGMHEICRSRSSATTHACLNQERM
jgi:hypothetical protein